MRKVGVAKQLLFDVDEQLRLARIVLLEHSTVCGSQASEFC